MSHTTRAVAAFTAFLALLAVLALEDFRWWLYRLAHQCIEVEQERRVHLPDRTTWRCADGRVFVR